MRPPIFGLPSFDYESPCLWVIDAEGVGEFLNSASKQTTRMLTTLL